MQWRRYEISYKTEMPQREVHFRVGATEAALSVFMIEKQTKKYWRTKMTLVEEFTHTNPETRPFI
jgi:hypothetical protein